MAIQRAQYNSVPPMGERLIIIKNNIQTALQYQYSISLDNISVRAKSEKKAFAHGGTLSGDGYIDAKKIKIGIDIKASSQAEHDSKVNELLALFYARDYRLVNGRMDSYYNVASLDSINHKYQKGFKNRWSDLEISLLLTDPFRYAMDEAIVTQIFDADSVEVPLLLSNDGSVDTPLHIELIPTTTMPNVTIKHVNAGDKFTVRDSLLTKPKTLKINSAAGTVFRGDGENAINTFSGQFLNAVPGSNTFLVSCAAGSVKITYRSRWFI